MENKGDILAVLLLVCLMCLKEDTRPWWTGSICLRPIFFVLIFLNKETAPVLRF